MRAKVVAMLVSRRRALVLFIAAAGMAACPAAAETDVVRGLLEVETEQGRVPFRVEIPQTQEGFRRGLMFRKSLAADAGMLFLWRKDLVASMWMKNTYVPLDMLFIDSHGVVVMVEENTVPESLRSIVATQPVRAVLELNAGTARRFGIKPGSKIHYPASAP